MTVNRLSVTADTKEIWKRILFLVESDGLFCNELPYRTFQVPGLPSWTPSTMELQAIHAQRDALADEFPDMVPIVDEYLRQFRQNQLELEAVDRIHELFRQKRDELVERLSRIPGGVEKARGAMLARAERLLFHDDHVYEALVYLSRSGFDMTSQAAEVLRAWQEEEHAWNERKHPLRGRIFWVSNHGREELDAVARIRFREEFGVKEFAAAFAEAEKGIKHLLLGQHPGVAFALWLVTRTQLLKREIRRAVRVALRWLVATQEEDGSWWNGAHSVTSRTSGSGTSGDERVTSLACVSLASLGETTAEREAGERGARWLLACEGGRGYWSWAPMEGLGWDLEVTCLAAQAIHLLAAGDGDLERRVRGWLLHQQCPDGLWGAEESTVSRLYRTVLVLETLDLLGSPPVGAGES